MEIFDFMHFAEGEDRDRLDTVIAKFEELCIGETNETYERFVFSSRVRRTEKRSSNTPRHYALCQTCNFCSCLQDSLLRDRIVTGIRDELMREKLLLEQKLTLAQALDICRSNEAPPSS